MSNRVECIECKGECKRADVKFCPFCGKENLDHKSWHRVSGDWFVCQECHGNFDSFQRPMINPEHMALIQEMASKMMLNLTGQLERK